MTDDIALIGHNSAGACITAEDVLRFRREIFADGVVDWEEAKELFRMNDAAAEKDPAWLEFYVEALTDFFVWQSEPAKYVSEEQARFLIDRIARDGRIDSATELELLINITHWALSCPMKLITLVLEAVRDSVLTPDLAAYGKGRRAGIIDPVDVEIIRKVIYGSGSGGGYTVTRREAKLLFELNGKTTEKKNARSWRDLFVMGVANFLMFPRGAPVVPDATEELRREAWLAERRGVGKLLAEVGKTAVRRGFWKNLGLARRELDAFGTYRVREETDRKNARQREAFARESIDRGEAQWLIGHIAADGKLSRNERALLAFIRDNATQIDPALDKLISRARK